MKIRNGFVSNSSASSFIIPIHKLNDNQLDMLYNHIDYAKEIDGKLIKNGKEPIYEYYEQWSIEEDDFAIWCYTSMDNFYLIDFLINEVKVKQKDILLEDDIYWWDEKIFDDKEYKKIKSDYQRKTKIKKIIDNF